MLTYQMGEVERRFAEIIWENEPVSSTELTKIAQAELNWKKSTAYTVLRRLCEKEIFRNADGAVTSLLSREEYDSARSENFVEETFEGSLPAFIAAFTSRKKLTAGEIEEIRRLIDRQEDA